MTPWLEDDRCCCDCCHVTRHESWTIDERTSMFFIHSSVAWLSCRSLVTVVARVTTVRWRIREDRGNEYSCSCCRFWIFTLIVMFLEYPVCCRRNSEWCEWSCEFGVEHSSLNDTLNYLDMSFLFDSYLLWQSTYLTREPLKTIEQHYKQLIHFQQQQKSLVHQDVPHLWISVQMS
jgi:hypothetical protein